ncbi:TIGR04255 family protein [Streptomyces microflavus]|uniref:TIGR04255 family protein n=1 Tax=Streptomyces microflavus TaxID=1919 RepID=UPI0038632163|nr:TIGR04255 family protein [Streptomyces microflavus]
MGTPQIYPHPPLVLAVIELRHDTTPTISESDQAALKSFLSETFPLSRPAQPEMKFTITPTDVVKDETPTSPRFMSRDNTASITFRPEAIVVETTRYVRRSVLKERLRQAIEARQKVSGAGGVARLGVRYINEVRASTETPADWSQWISPALTSSTALTVSDTPPQTWQGLATFGDEREGLVLRHGNLEGYAVNPAGDLRRPTPPPGPYYLLDIDSYWSPEGDTPPLDWDNIESRYDDAALLAYNFFQQLVTDKYRQEVLLRDQ